MLGRQQARGEAEMGSIQERMQLQSNIANREAQERAADIESENARNRLMAQMEAARYLGNAQLQAANQPDMLSRLSFGVL